MKKLTAILLALILFVFPVLTASADALTDGFDPETVLSGLLSVLNEKYDGMFSAQAGEETGDYTILYRGNGAAMLYFCHVDEEGNACDGDACNHAALTVVFSVGADTSDEDIVSYLTFWTLLSASLMQYLTGTEADQAAMQAYATALDTAAASPDYSYSFTAGGYDVTVLMGTVDGRIYVSTVVDIPGLY